jgi:hypothetical protein
MTISKQNYRVPTLKITQPLDEDGNLTSIRPLSGLMSMGKERGFDVDINLVPYGGEDTHYHPTEDESVPWDATCEEVDRITGANVVNLPSKGNGDALKAVDDFLDEDSPEKQDFTQEWPHPEVKVRADKPVDVVIADHPDGGEEVPTQRDYYDKAMAMKMENLNQASDDPDPESDIPDPINVAGMPSLKDCLTTAQVARCLFGCGSEDTQKVLHRNDWRERLEAFQLGGKGCKVYWPRANVKAFKANMDSLGLSNHLA